MLDNQTKRRIDHCRDILVGKLPDPKSQIEQITIGLIYKFMDDMDKEAVDMGGKAKFFSGKFEKYSWDNLFDTKVTAVEMLRLYSEAIESMEKNPNIPQLFRDIFKNAYLPYRDPETLKLFLKTIGEFEYTHSEKLGDAFEYLLSVMGSQGDAGQFRTPRHIIDFLIAAVDPNKKDTILDPACGTAGFLISAFKHIKEKNNNKLTPEERKRIIKNFVGYDISPDMVRLSLVNLYLHGFSDPHISEYDTLSSEERWEETFDVILANPPFMSPKGGIRPHKKFSIASNRSEVLFVDYIAEHLNPKGRAGIIVPEGVIFQSGTAYKDLRKMLLDNYLFAVVSLPAGVFNPYSGVKTSILLIDKEMAKRSTEILFIKITNDGYNLGAQRNPIKGSQLDEALETLKSFVEGNFKKATTLAHVISKTEISKNGEFNLTGEKYKEQIQILTRYPIIKFEESIDKILYTNKIKNSEYKGSGSYPVIDQSDDFIAGYWDNSQDVFKLTKPVTIFGDHTRCFKYVDFDFVLGADGVKILQPSDKFNPKFFYYLIRNIQINNLGYSRHYKELKDKKIPLPPLSVQEKILTEIEGYQKIIEGAKAIVENYKPKIDIDPNWKMGALDSVVEVISGNAFDGADFSNDNPIRCIKITNVGVREFIDDDSSRLPNSYLKQYARFAVSPGNLVISLTRTIISSGLKVAIVPESWNNTLVNQRVAAIKPTKKSNINFIYYYLCSDSVFKYVEEQSRSLMQPNLSITDLKKLPIPSPSIEVQNEIVNEIQKEQELVNGNKELIEILEQKIKNRIAKVWGE